MDDIETQLKLKYFLVTYTPTQTDLQNLLLVELEEILRKNVQQINNYNLPKCRSVF
jgi:hypothetical protein